MGQKIPRALSQATRLGIGVLGALLLIALVDDMFELGLVGQHSRKVMAALVAITLGVFYKVGVFRPQAELTAEDMSVKSGPKNQSSIIHWLWCLTIALVPVVILGPSIYRGEPIKILEWIILGVVLVAMIRRWRRDRKQ